MACPGCGGSKVRPIGEGEKGGIVRRRIVCRACGTRWTIRETVEPGSIWRPGDPVPEGVKVTPIRRDTKKHPYTQRFEQAWAATSKTGSKNEAFVAYQRVGSPDPADVAKAWATWMASDDWQAGYVWHVSRWIRGRCFEQEPASRPRLRVMSGGRPAPDLPTTISVKV